jgi:type I restriction-modification system DNA methylase subunit
MEESVVNMTGLEMFAITGHFPKRSNNFKRQNSFNEEFIGNNGIEHYKNVYANPPYGGDKNTKTAEDIKRDKLIAYLRNLKDDMTDVLKEQLSRLLKEKKEEESKRKAETTVNLKTCSKRIRDFAKKHNIDNANDKESCSFILLMDLLDDFGVCCAVLKEGVFFDSKYSKIREVLLKNFNVTNVISVPQNAFENTSTKTSIIIFYNKKTGIAHLHTIERGDDCSLDWGAPSRLTVLAALEIARKLGARRITLSDESSKNIPGGSFNLSLMYFLYE